MEGQLSENHAGDLKAESAEAKAERIIAQHRRLRPFRLHAAAWDFFCKEFLSGSTDWRIQIARAVQQKRHDVESVASAGANPAGSTSRPASGRRGSSGMVIRCWQAALAVRLVSLVEAICPEP